MWNQKHNATTQWRGGKAAGQSMSVRENIESVLDTTLEIVIFSTKNLTLGKSASFHSFFDKICTVQLLTNYSAVFPANFVQIGWDLAILSSNAWGCSFFSDALTDCRSNDNIQLIVKVIATGRYFNAFSYFLAIKFDVFVTQII